MRFPVFGINSTSSPSTTVKSYQVLAGVSSTSTGASGLVVPVPAACTITKYQLHLNAAPVGGSVTAEIMVNGEAKPATAAVIAAGETDVTWEGELTLNAGDQIKYQFTPSTGPAPESVGRVKTVTWFNTSGKTYFVFFGGSPGVNSKTEVTYHTPDGPLAIAPSTSHRKVPVPHNCAIKALYVVHSVSAGTGLKGYKTELQKNGTGFLPVEITAGGLTGNASGSSTSFTPGDQLEVRMEPLSSPTTGPSISGGYLVEPENNGEIMQLGMATVAESAESAQQGGAAPMFLNSSWGSGSAGWMWFPTVSNITIKDLYVRQAVAPGTGKKRVWQFRYGNTVKTIEVAIEGAELSGNDTTHELTEPENLRLVSTPTGTPAEDLAEGAGPAWSFVIVTPQGGHEWVVTIEDSVGVADSLGKEVGKGVADSVTVVDAVGKSVAKGIADSVTITDAVGKKVKKGVADAVSIVDSVLTTLGGVLRYIPSRLSIGIRGASLSVSSQKTEMSAKQTTTDLSASARDTGLSVEQRNTELSAEQTKTDADMAGGT